MNEALIAEFRHEAATTRKLLDRVPDAKLAWKPHEKSMSLGQLATHLATLPGRLSVALAQESFNVIPGNPGPQPVPPASAAEIVAVFDQGVESAAKFIEVLTPEAAAAVWTMKAGDKTVISLPRADAIRALIMNHSVHHRGQLSVYLRLLDVPVPVIYGRSADENPFA